ncbi:MAG: FAD-dependent oxidoreductase, partial [Actinobacteria bacterium]|nr:FAD-dependent oxidoreductase [Actinomycetota bacterium]
EGAIWTTQSGYVSDPQLSSHNLQRAAEAKGGRFRFSTKVVGIERSGGRVTGVTLDDGTTVHAPVVVNVAGPHSAVINELAGLAGTMRIGTRPLRHEVHHVSASPVDPDVLWAAAGLGWFGQQIHRSEDGGRTWAPVGNEFAYEGEVGTHQWYDGSLRPWEFTRIWHLSPSPDERDVLWAGAQDAALFRTADGGKSWEELRAFRQQPTAPQWQPGAGGLCLHSILLHPTDVGRIVTAVSAAGVFVTEDGGQSWRPANTGLRSEGIPHEEAEVGHCVHKIAAHPSRPNVLFMQKHWDVMRSDDGGGSWYEVSGDLPTDFGFAIDVHAHEPDTVYVVPITSDSEHYPPDGRLRVYRSRTGGGEWEPLTHGLPQENCYLNVLRDALAVDSLDPCGIYVGTTGGDVYGSADAGDTWTPIVRGLPRVMSVEVQTLPDPSGA